MKDWKQHYKDKSDWHKENTPKMAALRDNTCEECGEYADKKNGVIHHLQYTGHDYKKTLEKLLSHNALMWLCKTCHKIKHTAFHRDEVNLSIGHSGFCALCDKFAWHAWFKLDLGYKPHYGHDNFPICDKCLKVLMNEGIMCEYQLKDDMFYRNSKIIAWGKKEDITEKGKAMIPTIKEKVSRDTFGSLENFKKEKFKNKPKPNTLFD